MARTPAAEEEDRIVDPETVETLLILGKLAFILGGGCTVVMGTLYAIGAGAVNYCQRRDRRDELMLLYNEGTITTVPTILNAYSFPEHES
jgi:hypothetical protein